MSFIEVTIEQLEEFLNTKNLGLFETVHIISRRGLEKTEYTHRCAHIDSDNFIFYKLINR
jgi:SHS2 domain-containing protein